jgi:exoribonuclease II
MCKLLVVLFEYLKMHGTTNHKLNYEHLKTDLLKQIFKLRILFRKLIIKTNKTQHFLCGLSKYTVKSWLVPIGKYCTKLWV